MPATTESTPLFTNDAIVNGAATLIGAFFGAMAAFLFQIIFQARQDRKAERLSAHKILFCLLQQTNTIILIQKDYIYPHQKSPINFLEIPAIQELDISKNLFDFSTFSFMLRSGRGRSIMYQLYMAQESYIEALRAINERSRVHRYDVQPGMAAAGIGSGKAVTIGEIKEVLGPLVFNTMVASTQQAREVMRTSFQKLAAVKVEFRRFVVSEFESEDFTDFSFPETFGLLDETMTMPTSKSRD